MDDRAAGPDGSRGTEGERVTEWRERRQCRRVQYADRDQQPCAVRRQISQSDQRRRGRAKRQEDFSPLRTDSLPLVSKIYWRQSADDAIMYAP